MLDHFKEIKLETPADKIISQIKTLITSGELNPGDKLPPERKLAEKFGIGRSVVRDAIRKLEFYGIVRTLPQSGTFIAGIGISALEGLITDVLSIEEADYKSLVQTRVLLEVEAAGKAAELRSAEDLLALKSTLQVYDEKVLKGESAVEEDLMFHIKIAEASGNKVLKSLMLIITPDIIRSFNQLKVCTKDRVKRTIDEHHEILGHIANQDVEAAQASMRNHLADILNFDNINFNV